MSGKRISFEVETEQLKSDIQEFGKSRGINKVTDLSRIALYEYIRRRLPKDAVTLLHKRLNHILNGVSE